jgi:hypothetical protein
MTKKSILFAAPLALAVGAVLATPAAAASWNPGQLRSEISQLDRQIDRAQRSGDLNRNEASRLRDQVDNLQSLYARYARGGFNRGELATLNQRVDAVQGRLEFNATDRDRRGNDRSDSRYDGGRHDDHRDRH